GGKRAAGNPRRAVARPAGYSGRNLDESYDARGHVMSLADRLFGRRLATHEEEAQRIGPAAGIPLLGLDALSSSAYGPEAALAIFLPLGALGVVLIVSIR